MHRFGPILGWTLVAATVGLILRALEERLPECAQPDLPRRRLGADQWSKHRIVTKLEAWFPNDLKRLAIVLKSGSVIDVPQSSKITLQ